MDSLELNPSPQATPSPARGPSPTKVYEVWAGDGCESYSSCGVYADRKMAEEVMLEKRRTEEDPGMLYHIIEHEVIGSPSPSLDKLREVVDAFGDAVEALAKAEYRSSSEIELKPYKERYLAARSNLLAAPAGVDAGLREAARTALDDLIGAMDAWSSWEDGIPAEFAPTIAAGRRVIERLAARPHPEEQAENCPSCRFPSVRRNGIFKCATADCNYVDPKAHPEEQGGAGEVAIALEFANGLERWADGCDHGVAVKPSTLKAAASHIRLMASMAKLRRPEEQGEAPDLEALEGLDAFLNGCTPGYIPFQSEVTKARAHLARLRRSRTPSQGGANG